MITSVSIERLRGIKQGELTDLTPLTVLLGPNGCGKSTVLDAMLIASGLRPWENLARSVTRHQGVQYPAPWVLWRRGLDGDARVSAVTPSGQDMLVTLGRPDMRDGAGPAQVRVSARFGRAGARLVAEVVTFDGAETPPRVPGNALADDPELPVVHLADPAIEYGQRPLYDLHMAVRNAGRRADVQGLLTAVTSPDAEIEILTEGDKPILHITTDRGTVPVALSGEGIRALTRTALEIAAAEDGTLLLEEPEVHQHPATMALCAKAIVAGVARGVQVVVSTHSLELVDDLIEACGEEHLDKLSVYRLKLRDGVMSATRSTGGDAKFAREGMEWDLR